MKTFAKSVFIFSIVIALSACSSNPEDKIVGKWKEIDATEVIEFSEEGTVNIADGGMSFSGEYTFVSADTIKLEMGGLAAMVGPMVRTVSIDGNVVTFTESNGETEKYRRIK